MKEEDEAVEMTQLRRLEDLRRRTNDDEGTVPVSEKMTGAAVVGSVPGGGRHGHKGCGMKQGGCAQAASYLCPWHVCPTWTPGQRRSVHMVHNSGGGCWQAGPGRREAAGRWARRRPVVTAVPARSAWAGDGRSGAGVTQGGPGARRLGQAREGGGEENGDGGGDTGMGQGVKDGDRVLSGPNQFSLGRLLEIEFDL